MKEELKTMASMDEENAQYTQGTRGTDGHASQENPGGSGAGSGTGSGSDSQSKLPPKPNKGGLRGVFGAANRQVADAAYSVV